MAQTLRPAVDPLVFGRVIGDVIDMFVPSAELVARYGATQISNGCEIKPSMGDERPTVHIRGSSNYYSLVMVDPDAPNPSEPTFREWLHWQALLALLIWGLIIIMGVFYLFIKCRLVVDIPGGSDASKGKEVMPYMGPQPPVGTHRYVFSAFQQHGQMEAVREKPVERPHFSTRRFSAENELGLPAAALYFDSSKI